MRANFFNRLNLKNNSRTVDAGGPCNEWEEGEAYADIALVTVKQGGVVARSSGTVRVWPNDDEWWLPAQSAGQLQRGNARADATLTVYRANGDVVYQGPWGLDLQLN
jgi:hypothetical protein